MSNGLLNVSGLTTPKVTTEEIILKGEPISDTLANEIGDFVIENFRDGTKWYRLYKSGWIEMGDVTTFSSTGTSVEFEREMNDIDYLVYFSIGTTTTDYKCLGVNLLEKTNDGFTGFGYNDNVRTQITANWEVKGYIKQS